MKGEVGTGVAAGMARAAAGTAVAAGARAAGTAVAVGTAAVGTAAVGMKPAAGTTMAGISAGTSTGGAVPDGEEPSPLHNSGMAGAGQGLSAGARAGGIGVAPGLGTTLVGDGAPAAGRGVACWRVP